MEGAHCVGAGEKEGRGDGKEGWEAAEGDHEGQGHTDMDRIH